MPSLFIDIEGPAITAEDVKCLSHPAVSGVVLFSRHYQQPQQLRQLIADLKAIKDLWIAVDHEGGRVQRFKAPAFTPIPAMGEIGDCFISQPSTALKLAKACGLVLGHQLKNYGIDFSFTPMLDIRQNQNPVIGDRSFGETLNTVQHCAQALIAGLHEAGCPAIGKHFPGHGGALADSHHEQAVDNRDYETLATFDLAPYRALIQNGDLDAVMAAHVSYPEVDPVSAGYSPYWLKTILKQRLNFHGLVFSDCLSMAGAGQLSPIERVHQSFAAGCDIVLYCNDRPAVLQVLKELNTLPQTDAERTFQHFKNASPSSVTDYQAALKVVEGLQNSIEIC